MNHVTVAPRCGLWGKIMLRLLLLTTALALPAHAQSPESTAQTPPPTDIAAADDGNAEIVVTAQKRTQNLQDVPAAVTVIGADALARQGGVNIENAQYLVPALTFRKSGTSINQSLFLRGVGTSTFSIAGEPSISTVLDGVVLSRAGEAFTDLVDIERIEVLRGPQGTLFGKNASAGVINIVSRRPSNALEGFAEGSWFSDDEWRARAALNVPLGERVRTRVTGFYGTYEGNIRNETLDRQVNGYERWGVRGIVEAELSETLTATLIGDYRRSRDDCCAEVVGTTPANLTATALPPARGDRTRRVAQNLVTRTEEDGWGVSLQLDAELGDQTVTTISAFRSYDNREIRDGDFLPAPFAGFNQLHDDGPQTGETFTQEIRLTSPDRGLITYVVGAYYSWADSERTFSRSDIVCGLRPGTPAQTALVPCGSPLTTAPTSPFGTATFGSTFQNLAAFGQGELNFTDRFRFIGGVRFTHDQLDVFHARATTLAGPGIAGPFDAGVFNNGLAIPGPGRPAVLGAPNGVPFRAKTTNNNFSGRAGLQYDLSDDAVVYATWARGYKGPAFNVFFNLAATGTNVIEPEDADSFEGGLKTTFLGGRLAVNLAGYYANYRNYQANNPDLVAGVLVTRFTNAGTVSTRGGELDLIFRAGRDLNLSGGVAYTDAHVDRFRVPTNGVVTGIIPSGTELGYAPEWKASLGGDFRLRTGGFADIILGAQGSYQSSQLSQFDASPVVREATTIDEYALLDLSASLVDADDRFRVTFQVKNVFDESFAAAITSGGPGGSYRYLIPREADRFFGVTVRANVGGR